MNIAFTRRLLAGIGVALVSAAAGAQTVVFEERFGNGLGQFAGTGSVYTSSSGIRLAGSIGSGKGVITSGPIATTNVSKLTLTFMRSTTSSTV